MSFDFARTSHNSESCWYTIIYFSNIIRTLHICIWQALYVAHYETRLLRLYVNLRFLCRLSIFFYSSLNSFCMLTCFHFVKAIKSSNPSPQCWVTTTLSICTRTATQVSLFGHWWQTHRVFNPFLCLLRFWDTSHTPMLPLVRHLQGDHWSHRLQKSF